MSTSTVLFLCDSCGHSSAEHGYRYGCGHTAVLDERGRTNPYVCACRLQPGEIIGSD